MILGHESGYNLIKNLKSRYDLEIECLCLNSHFMEMLDLKQNLNKYKKLASDFEPIVVLKESEFHSLDEPYYEMSLFCNKDSLDKFKLILEDRDIKIDIVKFTK